MPKSYERIVYEYIDIVFEGDSPSGKTQVWSVYNRGSESFLGRVKWYGPWRQYTFYPGSDTVWSSGCMRDIASMCESVTKDHRREKASA